MFTHTPVEELVRNDVERVRRILEGSCSPEMFEALELALDHYYVQIRMQLAAKKADAGGLAEDELVVKAPALQRALRIAKWWDEHSMAIGDSLASSMTGISVGRISRFEKAYDSIPKE